MQRQLPWAIKLRHSQHDMTRNEAMIERENRRLVSSISKQCASFYWFRMLASVASMRRVASIHLPGKRHIYLYLHRMFGMYSKWPPIPIIYNKRTLSRGLNEQKPLLSIQVHTKKNTIAKHGTYSYHYNEICFYWENEHWREKYLSLTILL